MINKITEAISVLLLEHKRWILQKRLNGQCATTLLGPLRNIVSVKNKKNIYVLTDFPPFTIIALLIYLIMIYLGFY